MKKAMFIRLAGLLCVFLLSVTVCTAQQISVPSGTIVVGNGSATASEYSLQAVPPKNQGLLKVEQAGVIGPDVTISVQINLSPNFGDAGFVYRTNSWLATNDTAGWYVGIMKSGVIIGHGSNSAVSSWHQKATVPMKITPGVWYNLKVIAVGANHKVFLNDNQVLEVNNPSFSDVEGYAGLRVFKTAASYKNLVIE